MDEVHGQVPVLPSEDAALLGRLPYERWRANGVPRTEDVEDRLRAHQLAGEILGSNLYPDGLRTSPLGPGWSTDIDAHVRRRPSSDVLAGEGWLRLDDLLHRVGSRERGRWAVVEDARVLSAVDIDLRPPPDPVQAVVRRAQRRDEVRLREVLEIRTLQREGHELPSGPVLSVAADIEGQLGGDELARWRTGTRRSIPASLGRRTALRKQLGGLRRRVRRRVVVAVSGVDGAGKSTLVRQLGVDLSRVGVPTGHVWARPGNDLGWLDRAARALKRLLGQSTEPTVRAAARGEAADLPSRRGVVGTVWATLVTLTFLANVWRDHLEARGVVLYDRHLLDALATLEVVYGDVDLRVPRWLVRRFLPTADLVVHLDVPAEVSVRRKPDPTFGETAVRRQLAVYTRLLNTRDDVFVLDATQPPSRISLRVLRLLVDR